MIYEVCVLVATIILGVLGIELVLWVRSIRKLTDEAKQSIQVVNTHLPSMLGDVQAMTNLARQTTEQLGGTVNEVAVSLEDLRKNPLHFVSAILLAAKQVIELWNEIRSREKKDV
ncbi:hypothetical protein [Desulfosporosinus fructosivorans]